jgi:hypothetical protein
MLKYVFLQPLHIFAGITSKDARELGSIQRFIPCLTVDEREKLKDDEWLLTQLGDFSSLLNDPCRYSMGNKFLEQLIALRR